MDEVLTRTALDISGRPWLVWKVPFTNPMLGTLQTEMIEHWFHSFAQEAGITLHVELLHGHNNITSPRASSRAWPARCGWRWRSTRARPSHPLDQGHAVTLALIDIESGNLHSVDNALRAAGASDVVITADPT